MEHIDSKLCQCDECDHERELDAWDDYDAFFEVRRMNKLQVKDIPDNLILINEQTEIESIGDMIGLDLSDYGCLFVGTETGEYNPVYACKYSIPYLDANVDKLI